MSLCPDAEYRASLSEDDFWPYVLLGQRPGDEPDEGPDMDDPLFTDQGSACPECGEFGACAYDSEDRPMIHVIESDDE